MKNNENINWDEWAEKAIQQYESKPFHVLTSNLESDPPEQDFLIRVYEKDENGKFQDQTIRISGKNKREILKSIKWMLDQYAN